MKATTSGGHDLANLHENPVLSKVDTNEPSGASITSYATSMAGPNTNTLRVPNPPKRLMNGMEFEYGQPFECPYCRTIQIVRDRSDWRKHVFKDLQPYICTSERCTVGPFAGRHEWFEHESSQHRKEWHCIICSGLISDSKSDLIAHLKCHHQSAFTTIQLPFIADAGGRVKTYFGERECPLCSDWNPIAYEHSNARLFRRHLGGHMEQLALSALPKSDQDENSEVDNDSSKDDISVSTERPPETLQISQDPTKDGRQYPTETPNSKEPLLSRIGKRISVRFRRQAHEYTFTQPGKEGTLRLDVEEPIDMIIGFPDEDPHRNHQVVAILRGEQAEFNYMRRQIWFNLLNEDGREHLEAADEDGLDPLFGGEPIRIIGVARNVKWQFKRGSSTYRSDFRVIDMSGADVVIGADTLRLLQPGHDLRWHMEKLEERLQKKPEKSMDDNNKV
ncbi:hypothetical protein BJY04DRAFT_220798 [Aspergillus karnatakaensis]|uniref:uncharacterized protein n=1 Tax=Aspergillus karnatakaensis TaxID=1810916 RepID=UPI003CCDF7A3